MSGRLQIGALRFKGVMVDAAQLADPPYGAVNYNTQTVGLLSTSRLDCKRQTVWHEAFHPLLDKRAPGNVYLAPDLTEEQYEGFLDALADHAFTLCARSKWEENGKLLVPSYGR